MDLRCQLGIEEVQLEGWTLVTSVRPAERFETRTSSDGDEGSLLRQRGLFEHWPDATLRNIFPA